MNATRWIKSLVKERPDLYRAIYDWNVYPHRWALPAWLVDAAVPAPVIPLLEKSSGGRIRLGRHCRAALGLEDMLWDFQEPRRRLVLLSASTLARLARFTGAALHSARLAHVVTRTDRRALTEHIGQDAYDFALRHRSAAPAIANGRFAPPTDDTLAAIVQHAGWRLLAATFGDEPPALQRRFRLKVPRDIDAAPAAIGDASGAEAWDFLQPITRVICTSEEQQCFA